MKKHLLLSACLFLFNYFSFCQVKPQQPILKTKAYPQVYTNQSNEQTVFSGRVFDQETRNSMSAARVVIISADSNFVLVTTETNVDGAYHFTPSRLLNFRIEVTKSGYNKYTSGTYSARAMAANKQSTLPDILLSKIRENSDGPRPSKPTEPQTPVRDTTPLPREEFLSKKLFTEFNVLPTSSAYALYYALNPGLKDLSQVPPDYQIIRPRTTEFSSSLRKELSRKFSDDSEKDNTLQQVLQDSVKAFYNFYDAFQSSASIQYEGVNKDTTLKLISIINNDIRSYESQIRSTRKAKNIQLTNLVAACSGLIKELTSKMTINREDFDKLAGLSMYLSSLVESTSFINYFRRFLDASSFSTPTKTAVPHNSAQFAGYYTTSISAEKNDFLLTNDSRAFNVSVHLLKPDASKPISDGDEVNGRFIVSFFPAALKSIKALYIDCSPLATHGGVTLMEGIYEQSIIDSRTGKEMTIIGSGNNVTNTRDAFRKPAKDLFGKAIFTEIQILVKE